MKKTASILLLIFAFFLSYQLDAPGQTSVSSVPDGFYRVSKVIDGDTIEVLQSGQSETVRLIGIDSPETVHPQKPVQCFGQEASDRTRELLLNKLVRLEEDFTQSDRDKYGRLLRYVFLPSGRNVNKMLIEEGYAFEYTFDSNPYKYQSEFLQAQDYARQQGYGLWDENTCNG